jgi:hypothetical protein
VFPRHAAPSKGCYAPLETLDAGNVTHRTTVCAREGPAVRSPSSGRARLEAPSASPLVFKGCASRFKRGPPPLSVTHARSPPRPSRRRRPTRQPRRASLSGRPRALLTLHPPSSALPTANQLASPLPRAALAGNRQPPRPPLSGRRRDARRSRSTPVRPPKSTPSGP